jgi:hypothetical protein
LNNNNNAEAKHFELYEFAGNEVTKKRCPADLAGRLARPSWPPGIQSYNLVIQNIWKCSIKTIVKTVRKTVRKVFGIKRF